jgi:hypothetical protein
MWNSLYGTAYQFSKKFFTGWVIVSLLWAFFSFFSVTIFPIIEGRHLLLSWAKELFGVGNKAEHGDEFDHHQHRQRDAESLKIAEEKQSGTGTTSPSDIKEGSLN